MRRVLLLVVVVSAMLAAALAQGAKKRRPLPHEFGRVVINNYSAQAGLAPVVFDHWVHRAKYTCRLCHVDIGFAMAPGGTNITAQDNAAGFFCGACHDGRRDHAFDACAETPQREPGPLCLRCHSQGKDESPGQDFASFAKGLPKGRFGNGIDWERAEDEGKIKPVDALEGVSIPRPALSPQKDFALTPEQRGMPEIIFSHAKHTVWNGCELCHPDIFGTVKRGEVKYSMGDIFEGKYCGACHVTVAFPLQDCQRCHAKPVQ